MDILTRIMLEWTMKSWLEILFGGILLAIIVSLVVSII